jgi:hypothetical protein
VNVPELEKRGEVKCKNREKNFKMKAFTPPIYPLSFEHDTDLSTPQSLKPITSYFSSGYQFFKTRLS